ncbi:hypothetical protein JY97_03080 [Alkalispirochaeta odontotermitis]|nr:hypothetical protein JY97_03080 [Alkalispirochaeta odontotermitis]CAB1079349.1 hypothetical protein D1AOALGA4SA_7063 [Olavius algarvensis Delta 1 endosymbiont]
MKHAQNRHKRMAVLVIALFLVSGYASAAKAQTATELSDEQLANIVRRSYQYVALYNVNNKSAELTGGWNQMLIDSELKDHTLRVIARPNNDTLYITAMLDLRKDPVILEFPKFESKYVSLMVTGYDHYVNVPMTTRLGEFRKPEKVLFYTARTEGYTGEPVTGVDRVFEMTGDFVSAVLRVMPHATEPEKFKRIAGQMQSVKLLTLSEFRGGQAKPIDDMEFPPVGATDFDVFENNLLEVMQFVFNHTTFDLANEIDRQVLEAYKPLGIQPGRQYDPSAVKTIDGKRFRRVAEQVAAKNLAIMERPEELAKIKPYWMEPKGKTNLDALAAASVIGPIGLPAVEAEYPPVITTDGKRLNAMNDYVIRMAKNQLPPAKAFWSITLYDLKDGFFIPNDSKKYSVGENAGMKLNTEGGIEIYVAAKKPDDVPDENWLPINRKDEDLSINLRIYVPDEEKMKTWTAPKAEIIK